MGGQRAARRRAGPAPMAMLYGCAPPTSTTRIGTVMRPRSRVATAPAAAAPARRPHRPMPCHRYRTPGRRLPAYSGARAAAISRSTCSRSSRCSSGRVRSRARRCSWPSTLTCRWTTKPRSRMRRRLPASSTAPPPVEITWSPPRSSSSSAAHSRARKPASPSHSKIVPTAAPVRSSMSRSASTNASPKHSARRRPIDVLPAPIGPTSTRLGAGFMRGC